jgi:hypothetical protein
MVNLPVLDQRNRKDALRRNNGRKEKKKMEELNIDIGRRIQSQLCNDCKETLGNKIKKRHLLAAATPWGIKKLFRRIEKHSCNDCQAMIFRARCEHDARRQ